MQSRDLLLHTLSKVRTKKLRQALGQSRKNIVKKGEKAEGCHTGASLHRWRKSIKHHLYQLELAASEEDPGLKKEMIRLSEMEDRLGKIHDLDEFKFLLRDSPSGRKQKKLLKEIRILQKKLARKTFNQARSN